MLVIARCLRNIQVIYIYFDWESIIYIHCTQGKQIATSDPYGVLQASYFRASHKHSKVNEVEN